MNSTDSGRFRLVTPAPRVKFVRDARGRHTAVIIDLRRHRALWELFADAALAKSRARERKESLTAVRARLVRAGRLMRGV